MNVDRVDLSGAGAWLYGLPYSFRLCDISDRLCGDDTGSSGRQLALYEPEGLICTRDDESNDERYIAKETLYRWFVRLNVRLAKIGVHALTERQLLSKMNGLRVDGGWSHPPPEYIGFGEHYGLVGYLQCQNRYNFPMATVLSLLSPVSIQAAEGYMLDTSYHEGKVGVSEQAIGGELRVVLDKLCTNRERFVLFRRHGILGYEPMTLEEIGQSVGVTRERIRQIEARWWRVSQQHKYRRRIAPLLMMYVVNRGGSLLISSSSMQREIEFICKCLGIPLWSFPSVDVRMIGNGVDSIRLPDDLWTDLVNLKGNLERFISSLPLQLTQANVEEIAAQFMPIVLRRLTRTQKVCLALKEIGRPAHFSEIADMYAEMFPGECGKDHNIHAALLRGEHGVVWIGSKGMFALEEWGYERPKSSLMDTIAQIVADRYRDTGRPVPLIVIQAEIGRHRRVVSSASIMVGSYCNPGLRHVGDSCFLPRDEADTEAEEVSDDELDRVLTEFQRKARK